MAVMLPPDISPDTESRAESVVFERIRDQVPDSWFALHSLGLVSHRRKPWAEIDFVLVGPGGVYCLEVKGGRVERENGVWRFINKKNQVNEKREGPFEQVGSAAAALFSYLRDQDSRLSSIVVGYGVVTPDVPFRIYGPDVEPEVVYDETDHEAPFSDYVGVLTDYWHQRLGKPPDPLRPSAVDRIVGYLRGDFALRPSLRSRLRHSREDLVRLTDEQRLTVDGLNENKRTLVKGGAGTGKTLLALEMATAAAAEGSRVLFTCYSKRLSRELARAVANIPNLTVIHLHGFMRDVVEAAGRSRMLTEADADDLFTVFYPRQTIEGLFDIEQVGGWDVLVVDEAQDLLLGSYLDVFDALLDGGLARGRWQMFMDANQDLFQTTNAAAMERLSDANPARFRLSVNCRNTREIATEHLILSGAGHTELLKAEGPEVEHLWYRGKTDQTRLVSRFVGRLLGDGLRPEEIVVMGRRRLANSGLRDGLQSVPYRLVEGQEARSIEYVTISGFKGLESDVVILVDVDDLEAEGIAEDLYVATSRARLLLAVSIEEAAREGYEALAAAYGARLVAAT